MNDQSNIVAFQSRNGGRNETNYSDPVGELTRQGEQALAATQELRRLCDSQDPVIRRGASRTLGLLIRNAAAVATPPPMLGVPPVNSLFGRFRKVEDALCRARSKAARFSSGTFRRRWTLGKLVLSLAVAIALVVGSTTVAFALLILRLAISTFSGDESNLPFEARPKNPESGLLTVSRCILGHAGDVVVVVAAGDYLQNAGRPGWALLASFAASATVVASLFRVAALQVGLPLNRLQLERLVRTWSMVVGIGGTVLDPYTKTETIPLMAIVALGPLIYSFGEVVRTAWRLRVDLSPTAGQPTWVVVMRDSGKDTVVHRRLVA